MIYHRLDEVIHVIVIYIILCTYDFTVVSYMDKKNVKVSKKSFVGEFFQCLNGKYCLNP